ncbi:MAG: glutathione S-transferase [Pseudomonadota bacterium]
MKHIEAHQAPNPRRVRIFLAEKGIEVLLEEMALSIENIRSPSFTALNPVQRVPVLVLDDGTAISESVAICRYFEEMQPEPPLFGHGALGRAMVEMWTRRIEHHLLFHVAQCFRHLNPALAEREVPQVPEWGEANRPRAIAQLSIMDDALAQTPFIAGDTYSIAGITLLVAIDFMTRAKIDRPEGLSHLERWYDGMNARPSAAA